jgi:hypothetical protein
MNSWREDRRSAVWVEFEKRLEVVLMNGKRLRRIDEIQSSQLTNDSKKCNPIF